MPVWCSLSSANNPLRPKPRPAAAGPAALPVFPPKILFCLPRLSQIPDRFVEVAEITLREFYVAISLGKDREPSWKKAIYKVICKLDGDVPAEFKDARSGWGDTACHSGEHQCGLTQTHSMLFFFLIKLGSRRRHWNSSWVLKVFTHKDLVSGRQFQCVLKPAVVWGSWSPQNSSPALLFFFSPPFKRQQPITTPHRRRQTLMLTRWTKPFSSHRIDGNELKSISNMLNNVPCWCFCSSWFALLTMTTSIHRSHKSKWWRSGQPQRWFSVVRLWPLILNLRKCGKSSAPGAGTCHGAEMESLQKQSDNTD